MSWDSKKLAQEIKSEIVKNTLAGKDRYGKNFKQYSTKPFAMPHGAVANKTKLKKVTDGKRKKKGIVSLFTSKKSGNVWVTWLNGYKEYKKIMYGNTNPNLYATGGLLKSFTVLKVKNKGKLDATYTLKTSVGEVQLPFPEEVRITLGWTDKEKTKIAYYNKIKGRDMLGLPQKQLKQIVNKMLPKKK